VVLVECPAVLSEVALQEHAVHWLDDGVEARMRIVDVQVRVNDARRRHAEAAQERHRSALADHRRIGGQVVENQRAQAEELSA
jgi:hypothetical protein